MCEMYAPRGRGCRPTHRPSGRTQTAGCPRSHPSVPLWPTGISCYWQLKEHCGSSRQSPQVKCSGFVQGLTTGASSHQRPQGRARALPLVRRVAWRRQAQPPSSLIPGPQPLRLHLQTGAISPHSRPGVCRGRATTQSCCQDDIDLGVPPSPYVDHSCTPAPLRP